MIQSKGDTTGKDFGGHDVDDAQSMMCTAVDPAHYHYLSRSSSLHPTNPSRYQSIKVWRFRNKRIGLLVLILVLQFIGKLGSL